MNKEKSQVELARDIISQLKEMKHYAQSNVVKLAEFWLQCEEEVKIGDMAKKMEVLLGNQNSFNDDLELTISELEIECNRIDNEAE